MESRCRREPGRRHQDRCVSCCNRSALCLASSKISRSRWEPVYFDVSAADPKSKQEALVSRSAWTHLVFMSALIQPCVRQPYPLPSFVDDYAGLVAATFSRRFEDTGKSSINGLSAQILRLRQLQNSRAASPTHFPPVPAENAIRRECL
ncbi:MAG: hypothetical protein JWN63_1011 [Candidatus Acidoferrum typicum]|nr:hypothetical protein [Candidatus Acidoferrum typicum]